MKLLFSAMLIGLTWWTSLWFTPDQAGQRLFRLQQFNEAAETFRDPIWQGVAWYRAGEFEKAATAFARAEGADARYNQGNAFMLMGQYEQAVEQFDKALIERPDWQAAITNRTIAAARAEALKEEGGDFGDQQIGADEIRFDKKNPGGQETTLEKEKATTDSNMQALWLRRVQTSPSDFLKTKFQYQLQEVQE